MKKKIYKLLLGILFAWGFYCAGWCYYIYIIYVADNMDKWEITMFDLFNGLGVIGSIVLASVWAKGIKL